MTWRRAWAIYCAAHFGKSLLWTGSDLLTLFLLVSVYRLDPAVAGMLFLIGLAANAVADLAIGTHLSRYPGQAPRLAAGALLVAGASFPATVLLAPQGAGALLAATLVFRIAYSGCDVPHNALLTRLGDTPARAVSLARGRTVGTALASLLAAGVAGHGMGRATPLLWGIGVGGALIGAAMIPLLRALPPSGAAETTEGAIWRALPMPFLTASVIGIVALGALAKAVLHLPPGWRQGNDATWVLNLLILGRTASALLPIRLRDARQGMTGLAMAYAVAALVAIGCAGQAAPPMLLVLGLMLGATNLLGWAILPVLGVGPRGYGLYTMASKLALGGAGLMLAGGLGRVPNFTEGGYVAFAVAVAAACLIAALLSFPGLTRRLPPGLPVR